MTKISQLKEYLLVVSCSLVIFCLISQIWHADLRIPFVYSGDANLIDLFIKSTIAHGWFNKNPDLSAPTGVNFGDYPVGEFVFFSLVKIASLFTSNYAIIINCLYILSFPLTSVTSLFVFRQMEVVFPFSLIGSLLFAFQPYHFGRGETHILLSFYYMVPLSIWLAMLISEDSFVNSDVNKYASWSMYLLICVFIGLGGIYYAYFAIFFILVAGLFSTVNEQKLKPLFYTFILISVILLTMAINLSSTLLYWKEMGMNSEVGLRAAAEAEIFGLKIIQLLLPINSHGLVYVSHLINSYNHSAPLSNENSLSSLGTFGSIGFVILLIISMTGFKETNNKIKIISSLNLAAVLFATIGGFGAIVAYAITPMIRAYNRISIFIAFFSIYAFIYFAQEIVKKSNLAKNKIILFFCAAIILTLGILTQVNHSFAIVKPEEVKREFVNDMQFVNIIESSLPNQSAIFQLPLMKFPESENVYLLNDYDLLKGYLHSRELKWSYGAMRGRIADNWQDTISREPTEMMLRHLVYLGFKGIYIDRKGYNDAAANIESQLSKILNENPITSSNNRLSFYTLLPFINTLKSSMTPQEWNRRLEDSFLQLQYGFTWTNCSLLEGSGDIKWRWCDKNAKLNIQNLTGKKIKLHLKFDVYSGDNETSHIKILGLNVNDNLIINNNGSTFDRILEVAPGNYSLNLQTNTKPVIGNDPRPLYFRIMNLYSKIL